MVTPEQKNFFHEQGYLLLQGALSSVQLKPVREHVLDELKRRKILVSGKLVSASIKSLPLFQQVGALSQVVRAQAPLGKLLSADLLATMKTLADARPGAAGAVQLLLSPPRQGAWTLQGLNWHTDLTPADPARVPGVQAFMLLDDLQLRGGATLAIAGSQRADRRSEAGRRLREILRGSADIEEALRASGLSVLEMAGRAGDVYLMDMRLLHTPSVNATRKLRMMATVRYVVS